MKHWTVTLVLNDQQIVLGVSAPREAKPLDDFREVNFVLPNKGLRRAVFFLLPDPHSDSRQADVPTVVWPVPVRWDDKTMLYVPTLEDQSLLSALSYILLHDLDDETLENDQDISRTALSHRYRTDAPLEENMEPFTYRFRTVDCYGTVILKAHTVKAETWYRGSRWEHETPYETIAPYPARWDGTTSLFWISLSVGLAGLAGGIWGWFDPPGTNMTSLWSATLVLVGLVAVLFAFFHRRDTWIFFFAESNDLSIRYCRRGPDSDSFEEFSNQLITRIEAARMTRSAAT